MKDKKGKKQSNINNKKSPLKVFEWIGIGIYTVFVSILNFIKYMCHGIVVIFYLIFRLIYFIGLGFCVPIIAFLGLFKFKGNTKKQKSREEKLLRKAQIKLEKDKRREEKLREKQKRKDSKYEVKQKKEKKDKDVYKNENVIIEKEKISDKFKKLFSKISNIPQAIKDKYNNSTFVKNRRNKKDIERQALLINFEGEDAEKSDVKLLYEYVAKDSNGKVVKGYFEAFSKVEVHSFLLSEGFEVYSIKTSKWIRLLHAGSASTNKKIKIKDLIFFLTQLSTYIKAGIPLVDSLKILSRQYKNKSYKFIFRSMIFDLSMGDNFSTALEKQGKAFPRLLINMIKTSEMTGELPEALDDMANYYTETNKTKKQMVTALMYPMIVLFVSICVIIFIMVFVIPKFVAIYDSLDPSAIPQFTRVIIGISDFLQHHGIMLALIIVASIVILVVLYKNVKMIRAGFQWVAMHMPVFGNVIIYNEVTMFTKTFASLLSHNVFITDSMEILNKITNNEIYKMLILDTITNLAHGDKISLAFKDQWAFPIPAYEMLVTGEKTGELPEMMEKVAEYYQELHKESVARIKTFLEPILIIFLTAVVGVIVLAVVIPMFGMYSAIGME